MKKATIKSMILSDYKNDEGKKKFLKPSS